MSATAEDVTAQIENKPVDAVVIDETKPAETTAAEPEATAPAETAPVAEPKPEDKPKPWYNRRIDQLTFEKHEAIRRAEAAEAQARQYQDAGTAAPISQSNEVVLQQAAKMLQQQQFNQRCNDVYQTGLKDERTAGFKQAVDNFGLLGGLAAHPDLLDLAVNMDAGHLVIHHLGTNLDEAQEILSLPPAKKALKLAELQIKLNQPRKSISTAAAPVKPIGQPAPVNEAAGPDDKGQFKNQADYRAWRARNKKK